jgi:hypothetical protein
LLAGQHHVALPGWIWTLIDSAGKFFGGGPGAMTIPTPASPSLARFLRRWHPPTSRAGGVGVYGASVITALTQHAE